MIIAFQFIPSFRTEIYLRPDNGGAIGSIPLIYDFIL